jgi:hypothetical protein
MMNMFNINVSIRRAPGMALQAAALLGLLCLAGCAAPLTDTGLSTGGDRGRITISFGETALPGTSGARNLFPAASGFTRYEVSFAGPGGAAHRVESITGGASLTVALTIGDWTLTADAFTAASPTTAVAAGRATISVEAGRTVQANIILQPAAGTVKGTFEWNITIQSPATIDSGTLALGTSFAGHDAMPLKDLVIEGARTGTVELAPGIYYLNIQVLKNGLPTGRTEVVYIYPGLTTKAEYTYKGKDVLPPGNRRFRSLCGGSHLCGASHRPQLCGSLIRRRPFRFRGP